MQLRLISLGVEHSLSKRKVVGSNPTWGYFFNLLIESYKHTAIVQK